jgi:hypothetical protein
MPTHVLTDRLVAGTPLHTGRTLRLSVDGARLT